LRAVYGGGVPLPIDLRDFGAFRVPSHKTLVLSPELMIPLSRGCDLHTVRSTAPACEPAECDRWLNRSEARRAMLALAVDERHEGSSSKTRQIALRWERAKSADVVRAPHEPPLWPSLGERVHTFMVRRAQIQQGFPGSLPDFEYGRWLHVLRPDLETPTTNAEPRVLLRWAADRRATPQSHSWVEVQRFFTRLPEGLVYGCWTRGLVAPLVRGSGMRVFTGKLLVAASSKQMCAECDALGLHRYPRLPPELGPTPDWLRIASPGPANGDLLGNLPDSHLAACARLRGYDSVWIVDERALVLTSPQCTQPGTRHKLGACLPPPTDVRTGWDGERACRCADQYATDPLRASHAAGKRDASLKPHWALTMNCAAR
jgi:hypothetical protein